MGVDIGMKHTGTVLYDIWSSSEHTYSLVKMQQNGRRKSPFEVAMILQKLVVNNGVTCSVAGIPNRYPSREGISNDFVSMVVDITRTRVLSFLPFAFVDEYGSSQWAVEKLKTKSKEMQQRPVGKHMLSAEYIVDLYLAECCNDDSLKEFKDRRSGLLMKRGEVSPFMGKLNQDH